MQNRIYHPEKGIIRRVTEVAEVVGMENNKVQLNKIYEYNYSADQHKYVAVTAKTLNEIAYMKGLSNKEILEELNNRERYLLKNIENKRCDLHETKEILNNYYYN
jgi:flagellar protein FlaI